MRSMRLLQKFITFEVTHSFILMELYVMTETPHG